MDKTVAERSKQRRRILKAAAGVPVAFMLPSGAALAASSGGACLNGEASVLEVKDTKELLKGLEEKGWKGKGHLKWKKGLTTGDSVEVPGLGEYIYDGDGKTGRLVSASCWNSINAASASVVAATRIV